jgi:hypothetical protein
VKLSKYFDETKGYGVLATADSSGKVNAAICARPYFIDENTVVLIMAERLTYANLQTNPHAAYLFIESGQGYSGKRLHLTKMREESNDELVDAISQRYDYSIQKGEMTRHVVFFNVDGVLPLIGPGP